MGGFLKNGTWHTSSDWENDDDGHFERQATTFRDEVTDVAPGRYHLYVSYACPWACRTLMVRAMKGLEDVISVSVVHHFMGDDGWAFRPDEDEASTEDHVLGADSLREIYLAADASFTGRVTVPVLWDRERRTIVNNESSEIIRMLDRDFHELATRDVVLYPEARRGAIDAMTEAFYEPVNNGVYRCGFASSQKAYEKAFTELFDALAHYDELLGRQTFLCGEQPTLADVCMFTTLIRFDPVYYVHFKCNGRLIAQFDHLPKYVARVRALPGVESTIHLDHIKRHYYASHPHINPRRIVAKGPLGG
ncbi:MAG TPA: glutathione S-transferase family protein [Polyangiaceae bacterium]|nr:glutathione S-transferase family protein [Polyangiaceae bacterium]